MTHAEVPWRNVWLGLSIGGGVGVLIGITAQRNSYAGVGMLYLAALAILVGFGMLVSERSRPAGAILVLAAFLMVATSWGVMVLRGL